MLGEEAVRQTLARDFFAPAGDDLDRQKIDFSATAEFDQEAGHAWAEAFVPEALASWRANAWAYAATGAVFGGHERAAEIIIETIARRRAKPPAAPEPAKINLTMDGHG